jgi:hypothetical protein
MCEAVRICNLPDVFWVQAIPTSHNIQTCNRHLAHTVRKMQDSISATMDDPESPYAKKKSHETHYGAPVNNYARITVKMRMERDNGKVYWQ